MSQTVPAALRAAAAAYADRPAVVDGSRTVTFAELHDAVRTTARAYASLGVEPGDRVTLWAPNSLDWVVTGLAVSYAGATLVPLNTRYKGAEVAEIVGRSGARLLVVEDGFLGRSQYAELVAAAAEHADELGSESDLVPGLPTLAAVVRLGQGDLPPGLTSADDLPARANDVPLDTIELRVDGVGPDDVADIMFTSGTTGRSKGVCSAHRQTVAAADVWARTCQVTAEDRYLVVNPFFHSFGYKAGIVVSLLTGCTLLPQATFDVDRTLQLVAEEKVTVLPGAPAIFHSLFEAPALASTDLSSLRLAVTGAATVPVALVERMQAELSFDTVLTAFGMTECVVATMCRPGDPDELVAATCGRAVEGLELRIAEETGEILLRGPMVMLGYLDDPDATAEAIDEEGWLHTGDVGAVDGAGYLTITDRLKDMYICGGFNVYPAEVEQTLARLDGVVEAAVVGVPDERLGEVGKAFVVRRPGSTLAPGDVIAFAKERLANFKVPREVELVDALPRNLAGKVLKNALRDGRDATSSRTAGES